MRQRRPRSRSVSPEHFRALQQICTHAAEHSRAFCACPPWFPTLSRAGTRSDTPLWMTAAHRFGRLSPSPSLQGHLAPHDVKTAPGARLHPRARGRSAGDARLHAAAASPARPYPWPPPCSVAACSDTPSHRRAAASPHLPCIFHPDATSPPSQLVAPPFRVHATCWPDASQGTPHAPITACARGRSVAPTPVLLPPHPHAPSFACTFLRVRHLAPPPPSPATRCLCTPPGDRTRSVVTHVFPPPLRRV